jgi:hypothetical protein
MALPFQVASTPLPTDLPFTNYGAGDIPSNVAVIIDAQNVLGLAGDGVGITLPAAGGPGIPYAFGVTMERIRPGASGRVRTQGEVVCKSDGAVAAGTRVCVSVAQNKAGFVRATAPGEPQLGLALTSSTDGDEVLVLLQPASNA